jgi:DNA-binding beta-propeller fold protein YncE
MPNPGNFVRKQAKMSILSYKVRFLFKRRVAAGDIFAKEEAVMTDPLLSFPLDRRLKLGVCLLIGLLSVAAALSSTEVGSMPVNYRFDVKLDNPGLTTAGIFNSEGRLVRVLWTMKRVAAGTTIPAVWNGLDQDDKPVPPGEYTWKVVTNRSIYRNIGVIGNTGLPTTTSGHVPMFLEGVAVDANDAIYTVHDWDEPHHKIIKWSKKDGLVDIFTSNIIGEALLKGIAVEPDGSFAYVSGYTDLNDRAKSKFSIWRVRMHDGKGDPREFDPRVEDFSQAGRCIKVYDGGAEFPEGASEADKNLMSPPLLSLALRGDTLYATDALKGRVLLYDKASGALKREIPVSRACGLAVAPDGKIWVGHDFSKVSVLDPVGKVLATPITDLKQVRALALRGDKLYVADRDAAQVRIYTVNDGKVTLAKTFGKRARPGDRASERLESINGMAADSAGNIIITDRVGLGGRIQKVGPDFKPVWSQMCLEFSAQATYSQAAPDIIYSSYKNVYKVDKKTGQWEFLGSGRTDTSKSYFGNYDSSHRGPPRIVNLYDKDFYFFPAGDGIAVYRIDPSGDPQRGPLLNLVAAMALSRPLPNGKHVEEGWLLENRFLWSWHDEEGDNKISESEVQILASPGNPKDWEWPTPSMTVDAKGWIWVASYQRRLFPLDKPEFEHYAIYAIPPGGPDKQGNPIYTWESAIRVVDDALGREAMGVGSDIERAWKLVDHGDDGMIYALGFSKKPGTPQEGGLHMGGNTLTAFRQPDPAKVEYLQNYAWTVVLPKSSVGLSAIPGGKGGVLIGGDPWRGGIHHYSKDGLLIGAFSSDARFGVQPINWPSGLLDAYLAVNCHRDPRDGLLDVFAEDNMNHRLIWYRVDDRNIATTEGKIVVR